jgi:Domain of unknown function (DUF5615)
VQFLADESCDFAVVRALRAAGHDVTTAADLVGGADDTVVPGLAVNDARDTLRRGLTSFDTVVPPCASADRHRRISGRQLRTNRLD